MITVHLYKASQSVNEATTARGRTLDNALTNAARKAGSPFTRPQLVNRQGGGSVYHVQFGRGTAWGGTTLGDLYVARVEGQE